MLIIYEPRDNKGDMHGSVSVGRVGIIAARGKSKKQNHDRSMRIMRGVIGIQSGGGNHYVTPVAHQPGPLTVNTSRPCR